MKKALLTTVISLLLYFILVTFFKPVQIAGNSLEPKIKDGEKYFSQTLTMLIGTPSVDDVVIYEHKNDGKTYPLVGRIVAVPGDTVTVNSNYILVNDSIIQTTGPVYTRQSSTIPSEHYFILGGNSNNATQDSRSIGPVSKEVIKAHLWFKYAN